MNYPFPLIIDKIPKKIFGENISNLTVIIGKNGTGKSILLEAIRFSHAKLIEIYQTDNNRFYYYVNNYYEEVQINLVIPEKYRDKFFTNHDLCRLYRNICK